MKKEFAELIFVPIPGIGHIVSALEFANRLLSQADHIKITVLLLQLPNAGVNLDFIIKPLTASQPRIQVVTLPEPVPPPQQLMLAAVEGYVDVLMEAYKPHVRDAVTWIVSARSKSDSTSRVAALVLDLFCVTMIDIGNDFGIPSYLFFTSNAAFLRFMLYLPGHHDQIGREFICSDPDLLLSGFANPVPVAVLPTAVFNTQGSYAAYIKFARRFKETKGIILNTFQELESYAIDSFSDGQTPQVYPVGPVLNLNSQPHPELDPEQWDKTMKWLDRQPQESVLFLCFGSFGSFSPPQVAEIALGLEQSGCRFLWSLRVPKMTTRNEGDVKNPEDMLPAGFLERIGERGRICGWAAQVQVLAHKAIGGFLSHCGWNSILESLWHGVPIVTLPIYAEQQFNAFLMVKELGLAVELRLDYRADHVVKASEIERAVRCVMERDSEVRKKVREMGENARKAVMDQGGSSSTSIAKLIKDVSYQ